MSEINEARSVRPDVAPPSDAVREKGRRQLMSVIDNDIATDTSDQYPSATPPTSLMGRGRGLRLAVAGAAAAALIGGAVVVGGNDSQTIDPGDGVLTDNDLAQQPDTGASATDDGTESSPSATTPPVVTAPTTQPFNEQVDVIDQVPTPDLPVLEVEIVNSMGVDGSWWIGPEGESLRTLAEPIPLEGSGTLSYDYTPAGGLTINIGYAGLRGAEVAALPTDPTALADAVRTLRSEAAPDSVEQADDDAGVFDSLARLLEPGVANAELRAATVSALAALDMVTVTEATTDPLGRPATEVSATDPAFGGTATLYLDPVTDVTIADKGPDGSWSAYESVTAVAEIPDVSTLDGVSWNLFGLYSGCVVSPDGMEHNWSETTGTLVQGPMHSENGPADCPTMDEVLGQIEAARAGA